MDEQTKTDLIRALAEGRLSSGDARRARAELAADSELRAFHDAWCVVHETTAAVVGGNDAPSRPAQELAASRPARRGLVLLAAAAVLLILLGGILAQVLETGSPEDVAVSAIPLSETKHAGVEPSIRPSVSRLLASWPPIPADGIAWLDSLEEAREMSRLTRRPVLLFVYHPACPLCVQLRKVTFTDDGVRGLAAQFIPVHVDVTTASPELTEALAGWPYLAAQGADGSVLRAFPGFHAPKEFEAELAASLAETNLALALPWDRARDLAARYEAATHAEAAGHLAESWRDYEGLASDDAAGGFREAGGQGISRLGARARRELLRAEAHAASDVGAAKSLLDEARAQFAGTPIEGDFLAVRASLERTGRFPRLHPARA